MSGLELPGFVVGLSGLLAVFDKACVIWRTIAQAQEYGDDVARTMSKIEMEFFKFQAWWTVMDSLTMGPRAQAQSAPSLARSPLLEQLQNAAGNPLVLASQSILTLLEELEKILVRNNIITVSVKSSHSSTASTVRAPSTDDLTTLTKARAIRQKRQAKDLQESTSWFRCLKFDATPWKDASDKVRIEKIHSDFRYWNDNLYGVLPGNIRESVLQQGIAGFILDLEENAISISENMSATQDSKSLVLEYANLLALKQQLRLTDAQAQQRVGRLAVDMRISLSHLRGLPTGRDPGRRYSNLSLIRLPQTATSVSPILIEWYAYPPARSNFEIWKLAESRIARLAFLLSAVNRPKTLHSLNAVGFVDITDAGRFGLVSEMPQWAAESTAPVTLNQLLAREVSNPYPTLERRFELAAILASTLYTFMLTRWYHKRYQSHHIYFLYPQGSEGRHGANLTEPFVGGYSVSRPDATDEDTFEGATPAANDPYLHPTVRLATANSRPPFQKSFEMYSFGILLAEIGFWNVLPRIALGRRKLSEVPASEVKTLLIQECQTKLACWMGERYRNVTLRCLHAGDSEAGGLGDDLNAFYWQVVLELMKSSPAEQVGADGGE